MKFSLESVPAKLHVWPTCVCVLAAMHGPCALGCGSAKQENLSIWQAIYDACLIVSKHWFFFLGSIFGCLNEIEDGSYDIYIQFLECIYKCMILMNKLVIFKIKYSSTLFCINLALKATPLSTCCGHSVASLLSFKNLDDLLS